MLTSSSKKAAGIAKKVIEFVIANAERNESADIDKLKVKSIHIDKTMSLKRFVTRAGGRGSHIEKQTRHITITPGNQGAAMGQRTHPTGFRLTASRNRTSRWYVSNTRSIDTFKEDTEIRESLKKKLENASMGRVVTERPAKNVRITIYSLRPDAAIGRKGEGIELLKAELQCRTGVPMHVNIEKARRPEVNAQSIADSIT